jgi:hypothetical protein
MTVLISIGAWALVLECTEPKSAVARRPQSEQTTSTLFTIRAKYPSSPEDRDSPKNAGYSALAPDAILLEEVLHCGSNFYDVGLDCEMSGVKELNLRAW